MAELTLGKYVEQQRKEQNLSQRALANLAGLTNSTINRLESDLVVPDLNTIEKLSVALGVEKALLLSISGFLDIPEDFVIIARKTGELSEEIRAEMFHTLNSTIEDFLKNLENDEEDD